ncbi:DUF2513 domain-containing protein [bacterium]|nr:DUF2513 domain-containing protein [bacterium]
MKRDIDLIRKLLLYLEEKPDDKMVKDLELDGYSKDEVQYHFILMDQAGLLRCERSVSSSTSDKVIRVYPFSLTWQGHEFLEASRNDTFWNKAKEIVKTKSGALSVDVVKALLIKLAKESVGL